MVSSEFSGTECKAFRKSLKLTQQEFADKAGVSRFLIVKGERGAPSVLLNQVVLRLMREQEYENLKLQIKAITRQNEVTARALKGGEQDLAEEIQRLQKENADLRSAIRVMMAVRKQKQ